VAVSPSDRPNDDAWSDLEHGFFAAAPPDVPEPPPEPMRFDDLEDPAGPPPPPGRAQLTQIWRAVLEARRVLRLAVRDGYRRGVPAAARAWRRSIQASAQVSVTFLRWSIAASATVARRSAPALGALRIGARNHRFMAAGAAALMVVMCISAVVVASRGASPVALAHAPLVLLAGGACPMASEEEAPPSLDSSVDMSTAEPELGDPADTISPDPMPPPVRHKRKLAKRPARHVVPAKAVKPATPAKPAR